MSPHSNPSRLKAHVPVRHWVVQLAAVAGSWLAGLTFCGAQEARMGALLLKETDRVISGRIVRRVDFFEVEIASQSRVSIPINKVAHWGASLEELYEYKRQSVLRWSVGDHYQLTRWCLVNDLLVHAAEHFAEVSKEMPDHPRVVQLAVELEKRLLREPDFRHYLGMPPVNPSTPQQVVERSHRSMAEVVTANNDAFGAAQHPEIAKRFSERIQPILMNRCSQAACHGVQSSNRLRLLEPYAKAYARITSENLSSVLGQVSGKSTGNSTGNSTGMSSLLDYATRAHGIQRSPAIQVTESVLLEELQAWIAFAQNPVVSAAVGGPAANRQQVGTADQRTFIPFQSTAVLVPVQPGDSQLRQVPRDDNPQVSLAAFATFPQGERPPTDGEIDALDAQLQRILGESPRGGQEETSSADPFDPAEFNRKALQGASLR